MSIRLCLLEPSHQGGLSFSSFLFDIRDDQKIFSENIYKFLIAV